MKLRFFALLLLTVAFVINTQSQTVKAIPASFFGMHTDGVSDWPTVSFGALGKGTCEGWANEEKSHGVFTWSITDGWVNAAQSHDIDHFVIPGGTPPWALDTSDPNYSKNICR